jgi:hypothetical protein
MEEIKKSNAEKSKEYRLKNPAIVCERCGGKIHYSKKAVHERSKKHLWALENNFYFLKKVGGDPQPNPH